MTNAIIHSWIKTNGEWVQVKNTLSQEYQFRLCDAWITVTSSSLYLAAQYFFENYCSNSEYTTKVSWKGAPVYNANLSLGKIVILN